MIVFPLFLTVVSFGQFINPSNSDKGQSLKTCTLLGCTTEAVIDIRRSDLGKPDYEVVVEFDEVKQKCALPSSDDVSPEIPNCGAAVRLVVRDVPCTPAQSVQECQLTPKFEEHLAIFGTPAIIKITLFQDGKEIATDTLRPTYQSYFPNGENCDSGCKFWRTVWTIPKV